MAVVRHHVSRRVLHWAVAAFVLAMIPGGLYFNDFDNKPAIEAAYGVGAFDTFYNLHKAAGITVLLLVAGRLIARRLHPDPAYATPLPPMEAQASRIVHRAIYALLIVVPLLGWAGVSAYPAPLPFYGLFEVPKILPENRALAEALLALHGPLAISLGVLVVVHVAAAIRHRQRHDGVMARMGLGDL